MTKLTLATGAILTVVGVVAYFATGMVSITALIPAFVGILLLVAGFVARNPRMHMHAMHAALLIALLGALGSLMNVVKVGDLINGTAERPSAIIVSIVMFVILVAFLVAGIRSFVAARRSRTTT